MKKYFILFLTILLCACTKSNYVSDGNMKDFVKSKVEQNNLKLKWNINGNFNISEENRKNFQQINIGQLAPIVAYDMTLESLNQYYILAQKNIFHISSSLSYNFTRLPLYLYVTGFLIAVAQIYNIKVSAVRQIFAIISTVPIVLIIFGFIH